MLCKAEMIHVLRFFAALPRGHPRMQYSLQIPAIRRQADGFQVVTLYAMTPDRKSLGAVDAMGLTGRRREIRAQHHNINFYCQIGKYVR